MVTEMKTDLHMYDYLYAVNRNGVGASDALARRGYHPNVVYAKAEKAARKGYVEYGTSPSFAWITGEGVKFLEDWEGEHE